MQKKERAEMTSKSSEPTQWSVEKQQSLQGLLVGRWAADTWIFTPANPKRNRRYLRFALSSPSLKTEIKYAIWRKFDSGERKIDASQDDLITALSDLIEWFNHCTPPVQSLMEKTLEEWESSYRDYLIQAGQLRSLRLKSLLVTQEYVEYSGEDRRVRLLRQLHETVRTAYDDRPATERDVWHMRKMGLAVNLVSSAHQLNFAVISQPWLRRLAKEFIRYRLAVYSPGDCYLKLRCIQTFSRFLAEHYPQSCAPDIDRALIVRYIGFLRESRISDRWRLSLLVSLRTFLETCAYHLKVEEVAKERLIFKDDFPKIRWGPSREIPDEVLEQVQEHLETLPTCTLRMVVILLECGMRISELCTLPLDCLIRDKEHHWSLRSYQIKSKQEHVVPLINTTVVEAIQAQQREVRQAWGDSCRYLFPSLESHESPFKAHTFLTKLNTWALEKGIRDSSGKLYHFQTHQFRHTVAMQLINSDVPLDVISRLLGHSSPGMTQVYASKRDEQIREEIERASRRRKTVDYRGQVVRGDSRANAPDVQLTRKGIRGQTLPVGGCGRLIVLGECEHANKCLTCPFWLTSTEDLPALKAFHSKAIRLRQRAQEARNPVVLQNQDKIIPLLALRITSLENVEVQDSPAADELLNQLREDLAEAQVGRDEAREAGIFSAEKHLEQNILELEARIAGLEESL
jgi:integrase